MKRREFLGAVPATAALLLPGTAALLRPAGLARAAGSTGSSGLTTTQLAPNVLLIQGGGGNVTVLESAQGLLLIDGGSMERSGEVLGLVRERFGRKPIQVLINTHWHWDQTGSNPALGLAGARIIAHENTRLWLSTTVNSRWQNKVFKPLPKAALPTQTTYTTGSLQFGGEQIDYGYLPQAHTDGDLYVHLRTADVLVAGDVLATQGYPILDWSTNGWIGGMVNATQTLAGLAGADTRVVPGTGPVQSRADLQAEHEMLSTLKGRLSKLLVQGMSIADMQAAAPTREYDARWGDPSLFIANAWHGMVLRSRELGVGIV